MGRHIVLDPGVSDLSYVPEAGVHVEASRQEGRADCEVETRVCGAVQGVSREGLAGGFEADKGV